MLIFTQGSTLLWYIHTSLNLQFLSAQGKLLLSQPLLCLWAFLQEAENFRVGLAAALAGLFGRGCRWQLNHVLTVVFWFCCDSNDVKMHIFPKGAAEQCTWSCQVLFTEGQKLKTEGSNRRFEIVLHQNLYLKWDTHRCKPESARNC